MLGSSYEFKLGSLPFQAEDVCCSILQTKLFFFLPLFADLARNAGSVSSLQNRGMEHGRNCMGKACIFIPRGTAGDSPHSASPS